MTTVPNPAAARLLTTGDIADLASLLELEAVGRDRYRGRNAAHGEPLPGIYGGQAAAQALRAAAHTVEQGRFPHSLHCYFLGLARADEPVLFAVDRLRDGGSISARYVRAIQRDIVFFAMLTSFKVPEASVSFVSAVPRTAPPPEDLTPNGWDALVDAREVSAGGMGVHTVPDLVWCRVTTPMPDDPIVHACALAYISDYGGGFARLDVPGIPAGGPSLDHVLRFHQAARVDEWLLMDLRPERASDGRGSYTGTVTTRDGALVASLNQEGLLRQREPGDG